MQMLNFNKTLIKPNDRLIVAVSGGIDSMVLLHYLHALRQEIPFEIIICHINHHTRKATASEAEFVSETAARYGLACEILDFHYNQEKNFHHVSRLARYDFFKDMAKLHKANKIVLAHHAVDLAETILMRITRGSGFIGYAGILEKSKFKGIEIIRPMLRSSRDDISSYQTQYLVEYREDESNQKDDYTRNRFRHHVMPLIKAENPIYTQKFAQFSEYIQEAHGLINNMAKNFLEQSVIFETDKASLSCDKLNNLEPIIIKEIFKLIVDKVSNNKVEMSFSHLCELVNLSKGEKTMGEIDIDEFMVVKKSYDTLTFFNHMPTHTQYEFTISGPGEIMLPNQDIFLISTNNSNFSGKYYELWYNDLDLIFPMTIRNRRPGDRINLPYGTKKLKDLFIEKKVPHAIRDEVPLVFDKSLELLWIPSYFGRKKSEGINCLYLIYQKGI